MRVTVVGGGVAGASAAYFAARQGARVTVVDAGVNAASHVPGALVNPVRGKGGRVHPRAVEGMHQTWALVRELEERGYAIPYGQRGVLRPVPDERARQRWLEHLPPRLPHAWHDPTAFEDLAPGWAGVLELPTAGWLDGPAFTRALLQASGAELVHGWATDLAPSSVSLASGAVIPSERVVFCGGSLGVSRLGWQGQHRAGAVLLLDGAPDRPLSFGVYVSPSPGGGVLGATFEAPGDSFRLVEPTGPSLEWLLAGANRLWRDFTPAWSGTWRGSRLSTAYRGVVAPGVWALAGLGSRGFLLGPLFARELVEDPAFGLA